VVSQSYGESQVTASWAAAAVLQTNAVIISVVRYFIPVCSYHFVVAVWSAKRQNSRAYENKHPIFAIHSIA